MSKHSDYQQLENTDEISLANFDDLHEDDVEGKEQGHDRFGSPESNQSTDDSPGQEGKKGGRDGRAAALINTFQGYQNKIKERISEPPSWPEMLQNMTDFLQRPSVMIAIILLITLIYLSAQNGAMQRELDQMHHKLDKFEVKENKLQKDIKNMTKFMKDVKKVEDDLVKKENKLEDRVKEDEKKLDQHHDGGEWGADQVPSLPLMPHFGPPQNFQEKLHDLGERIHQRVMNLRKEIFDKDHGPPGGGSGDKPGEDDGFPHVRIIRMHHPPPFFPSFLNFDEDD